MKILFISEYYPPTVQGGGEVNLAEVAKALAKSGTHVSVLTSYHSSLPPFEIKDGVEIYRRLRTGASPRKFTDNIKRAFLLPRSIIRETTLFCQEQDIDIIHFIGISIIAAQKLQRLNKLLFATIESYPALCPKGDRLYHGKRECVITCTPRKFLSCQRDSSEFGKMKNKWYLKYNPLFLWFTYHRYQQLNKALSYCKLIAISSYVQNVLLQYHHESEVIPNAFDAAPFSQTSDHQRNSKPLILYVGELIESKGPQILLEALQGLDYRCELYGDGVLKEKLQYIIRDTHLDAKIFPPVSYQKMPEIYAKSDLVVFPSLWPEPFGRIPLEAMAARKPVIASNTGAISEIIGKNGWLFPAGDSLALRNMIQEILRGKTIL